MKYFKQFLTYLKTLFAKKPATKAVEPSAPVPATPVATTPTGSPVDPSSPIPATSQVPSTIAYTNPNRVVVDAKPVVRQTSLEKEGGPVEVPSGSAVIDMPGVEAGKTYELEVSRAYSSVVLVVFDQAGTLVTNGSGLNGLNIRFVAPTSGTYKVSVAAGEGHGNLMTVSHFRH